MSLDRWVLFSQAHCREVQCSAKLGMPSPPACVGVNIISFLYWFRLPFINLKIVCSISFMVLGLGRGSMVAIWVTLDNRQALVIFTFAVVDSFVEDHIPISVLMALMSFSQLMSKLSRLPFKYIPSSLKGSVSQVTLVSLVMSGESIAFPNRAYLVLDTLVFRPDRDLKFSRIFRISRSWVWGSQNFRNILMSSAYASISFL